MKKIQRRSLIKKMLGSLALGTLFTSIHGKSEVKYEGHGNFKHVVFFWLKNPDVKEENKRFLNNLRHFIQHVDVIKSSHIGIPADTSRDVIDNTYSYCLIVTFNNKAEHDIYQEHQKHKEFIQHSEDLWEKVLVYDSVQV